MSMYQIQSANLMCHCCWLDRKAWSVSSCATSEAVSTIWFWWMPVWLRLRWQL